MSTWCQKKLCPSALVSARCQFDLKNWYSFAKGFAIVRTIICCPIAEKVAADLSGCVIFEGILQRIRDFKGRKPSCTNVPISGLLQVVVAGKACKSVMCSAPIMGKQYPSICDLECCSKSNGDALSNESKSAQLHNMQVLSRRSEITHFFECLLYRSIDLAALIWSQLSAELILAFIIIIIIITIYYIFIYFTC